VTCSVRGVSSLQKQPTPAPATQGGRILLKKSQEHGQATQGRNQCFVCRWRSDQWGAEGPVGVWW